MSKNTHLRSRRFLSLDRALSGSMGGQILLYLIIVAVSFLLLFGTAILLGIPLASEKTKGFSQFWSMLFFYYDGGLEGTLPENRLFVYLANVLGSVLAGGVLIATLTNYLLSRRDKAENGLLRYHLSRHTVFIGFHEAMIPLVRQTLEKNETAVILSELPLPEVNEKVLPGLKTLNFRKLIIYHGMRTDEKDVNSLCLPEAKEVFIFPEPSFSDTDSVNLDVVKLISAACNGVKKKLKCTVLFHQNAVVSCFERSDVDKQVKDVLDFMPVIYGDALSRALLSGMVFGNEPLDREQVSENSDKRVHLFILGLGEIGQALFTQAVKQLHFPNFNKAKSVITLVGKQSDIDSLKSRYREFFAVADKSEPYAYLGDFLDLSVNTIPQENVRELDSALIEAIGNVNELVTVAVCLENSAEALRTAVSMPRIIFERAIPIWMYKPDSDSLIELLYKHDDKGNKSFYSNITLFGSPEKFFMDDTKFLIAAQRNNWVYEVYHQSGIVPDKLPSEEEWAKTWIPKWESLSIRNKWSNLDFAYSIPVKERSQCSHDVMYKVEHNRWVAENLLGGYRPPTIDERRIMEEDRTKKNEYKKRLLVHLDLCAFDDLLPDAEGYDVRDYDKVLVDCIPLDIQ